MTKARDIILAKLLSSGNKDYIEGLTFALNAIEEAQPIDEYASKLHSLELELTEAKVEAEEGFLGDQEGRWADNCAISLHSVLMISSRFGYSLGDIMERAVELKLQ